MSVLKWLIGAWLALMAAWLVIMAVGFVVAVVWKAASWWLTVLS